MEQAILLNFPTGFTDGSSLLKLTQCKGDQRFHEPRP